LPSKVIALYCQELSQGQLVRMPVAYNVLYLFAAISDGSPGQLIWPYGDMTRDITACRRRGQRIVLTIGGQGHGISFTSHRTSRAVVDSIMRINQQFGGTTSKPVLDGVDFNTFEGDAAPVLQEYEWMARTLRGWFGESFAITSPPAPWRLRDQEFCRAMLAQDLMDYVGPQFYAGPGLSDPNFIIEETRGWIDQVAGGDPHRIVMGFGVKKNDPYFSTMEQISMTVKSVTMEFPTIRGVFLWENIDQDPLPHRKFARKIAPLI
jgi:hypothetical protein